MRVRLGPCGVHLFYRETGTNVLLDELRVPNAMWSRAPRQVSIALTNACDLHCPYCYAPKHRARLDTERLTRWVTELDANGCLGVGFGGGEPTLHSGLLSLCVHIAETTQLAVTITTHGHRLSDRFLTAAAGTIHFIRVSMDGVGATYELLRGRSFSRLCRSLENVRRVAPFGINFVVNSITLPDLDAAITVANSFGATEFLLLPENATRSSGGIDYETVTALRDWVNTYRGPIPLSVSESGADGLPTCNALIEETGISAYAHIDADGVLRRSSYHSDGIAIGEGSVMQALATLERKTRRDG